jgi:hypothetical protein
MGTLTNAKMGSMSSVSLRYDLNPSSARETLCNDYPFPIDHTIP